MAQTIFSISSKPTFIGLDFDGQAWHWRFSEGMHLTVGGLWRLLGGGAIRWTSRDNGQHFGRGAAVDLMAEVYALLIGRGIVGVQYDDLRGDLQLTFEDFTQLEVIVDSSGFEAYQLTLEGRSYVAQGGGKVVEVT